MNRKDADRCDKWYCYRARIVSVTWQESEMETISAVMLWDRHFSTISKDGTVSANALTSVGFSNPLWGGMGVIGILPCKERIRMSLVLISDDWSVELGQTCEAARNGTTTYFCFDILWFRSYLLLILFYFHLICFSPFFSMQGIPLMNISFFFKLLRYL